eukprot:SAG25_NODE_7477_length_478_cov_1.097625_1_plen_33_part_01
MTRAYAAYGIFGARRACERTLPLQSRMEAQMMV